MRDLRWRVFLEFWIPATRLWAGYRLPPHNQVGASYWPLRGRQTWGYFNTFSKKSQEKNYQKVLYKHINSTVLQAAEDRVIPEEILKDDLMG